KYSKGRAAMKRMADAERKNKDQNIMVKRGMGRYPKCLSEKPYSGMCPNDTPKDPINVPADCKQCPQFVNSKFYAEKYMTHERRIENLKKRGLPMVLDSNGGINK
ncbi:MAG: hypothetical protein JW754_04050, partial [Candidatus Aenigmarchaeota archaeon]|nr:hypothetical protein [Candidatus Aenigmarchaeota archaeon]